MSNTDDGVRDFIGGWKGKGLVAPQTAPFCYPSFSFTFSSSSCFRRSRTLTFAWRDPIATFCQYTIVHLGAHKVNVDCAPKQRRQADGASSRQLANRVLSYGE